MGIFATIYLDIISFHTNMNRDKNNIVTFNNTNGIDIGKTKCFHTLYQIILFGQFYKQLKIDFKTEDVFLLTCFFVGLKFHFIILLSIYNLTVKIKTK